jgi:hypothetical protein
MLFMEIIGVYYENHIKYINTLCRQAVYTITTAHYSLAATWSQKKHTWRVPICITSLYNKIVMVLLHIMSAHALVVGNINSVGRCIFQQLSVSRQLLLCP